MKKISIIVPCYNAEKYLKYSVHSLLKQTIGLENIEMIFIDDASKDDTLQLLLEYERIYPEHIIVIPLAENGRQGKARNIGLTYATGEYTAYLDSDDWLVHYALEKIYYVAKAYDCDVVEFLSESVSDHNRLEEDIKNGRNGDFLISDNINKINGELLVLDNITKRRKFITAKSTLGCWNKVYKTSMLKQNNIKYAENLTCEEPAFTYPIRFYEKRHYYLKERLYFYYENKAGTMNVTAKKEERKYDHLNVQYDLLLELINRGLLEEYYEEIELQFFHSYFVESIIFMKLRGFDIDYQTLQTMQSAVLHYFPTYKSNKYMMVNFYKFFIPFVEARVDETNIDEINKIFIKIVDTLKRTNFIMSV